MGVFSKFNNVTLPFITTDMQQLLKGTPRQGPHMPSSGCQITRSHLWRGGGGGGLIESLYIPLV